MYQNDKSVMLGFTFKRNLVDLNNYIYNNFGCKVSFNYGSVSSFDRMMGATSDYGNAGLFCDLDMPPVHNLTKVSNKYFVESVVDCFHEVAHYNQFDENDYLVNYIAYMNNCNLYHDNYRDNKREIDAEHNGIMDAYRYLSTIYDEEKSENLLLDYVNRRVASRDYWLCSNKPFSSLSEASEAFEQRLAETMEVENNCCYKSRLKLGNKLPVEDEAALCMEPWKQEQSIWYPVYDSMNHSENMEVMERKSACLACYLHPDYFNKYPELRKYDLKPEHVFGFPFPESAESVNKRIKECLHDSGSTRKTFTYKEQDFGNRQVSTPDEWDDYYSEQCGGMKL